MIRFLKFGSLTIGLEFQFIKDFTIQLPEAFVL